MYISIYTFNPLQMEAKALEKHMESSDNWQEKAKALEKQVLENTKQIELLQAEKNNLKEKLSKRYADEKKKNVTYIYKDNSNPLCNVYTVGQTTDIAEREKQYNTHSFSGRMLYSKECYNHKVLEKLTHHMLEEFRVVQGREWFKAPYEMIEEVLDTAQLFMDSFVNKCEEMVSSGKAEQIREILKSGVEAKVRKVKEVKPEPQPEPELEDIKFDSVNDPKDFEGFINECFIINPDKTSFSADIMGVYRLWSRSNNADTNSALIKYLCEKFKKTKVLHQETKARLASYAGLELKPRPEFEIKCEYDEFIAEEFRIDPVGRVSWSDVKKAYVDWKGEDFMFTTEMERNLYHHIGQKFLPNKVFTTDSVFGFYGLIPKSDTKKVGLKLCPKLKKRVAVVDTTTKKVIHKFDSLTETAGFFKISPGMICQDIKFKRIRNNMLFFYRDDVVVGDVVK